MSLRSLFVLAWLMLLGLQAAARGQDPPGLSSRELVALTGKLRSKQVSTRQEAIKLLSEHPEQDTAKALIDIGLVDPAPEIRQAAYDALLKFRNHREATDFVLQRVRKPARGPLNDAIGPLLYAFLLSSDLPEVYEPALSLLDEGANAGKLAPAFAVNMADMLAVHHQALDVVALTRLTDTNLGSHFVVRRTVVRALSLVDDKSAIDALIGLLDKFRGEAQADVMEYLEVISPQGFERPAQWTAWWIANKESFTFPPFVARPTVRTITVSLNNSEAFYYGLPIFAKRLVFVIDASGSMSGDRIVAAKRELSAAVQQLKSDVRFNILVFNGAVMPWKNELIEATTANKAQAINFITAITPASNTATYSALAAALKFEAEAIYLLTDGAPTSGQYVQPDDIVEAVSKTNMTRRESIYTIGIGVGERGNPFDSFLKNLAERNRGVYRRVDE